ncbi:bifunctional diguanylate cyclase/phosphodiesterase [Pseudotabrizicola sp.]|uniref:putative bifunctional diguanylate cyclase/phosphodiesterase n=1 Tax=Pseudotabrizicola sp. TaxID=2939647 RepID=UPI002716B6E0|nr:bifunctional diguanylate cyclase/phosphodiesterase [Pseudotabrizicola sp.]MDO8883731.1 bifunctional diguanylate cyclase/phosphodiesterase [Pseudotabrizicola sp.]
MKRDSSIRPTASALLSRLVDGEALVLLPAVSVAAFWLGGEVALLTLAIAAPVAFALIGWGKRVRRASIPSAGLTGFATETQLVENLDTVLNDVAVHGGTTACFVVVFDDLEMLADRHGRLALDRVLMRTGERLGVSLRAGDVVARLPSHGFAISFAPIRRFDLENAVQMAARLQSSVSAPLPVDDMTVHPSVSVGFCLADRAPALLGASLLDAARCAADEALRNGPCAIRAYQPEMSRRRADRAELRAGLEAALDCGQIRPWFQPQLSTDTGEVSGFEALARWHHPERGIIAPSEFLPLVEDTGLSERLGEVILYGALSALTRWDNAGHRIARVSVNFSASELRNPHLPDKLKWELDRFSLTPDRLTIEVLETVVARSDDDVIVTNLAQLAKLGCGIDLDDFGTGQASIVNIRRFAVRRIKVDRCFVMRCDTDPDQKRMVAAILSLCEQLGLSTVAEGIETPGEHATVAQLGCDHVQGFGIARPMAVEETFGWIARHEAGRQGAIRFGRLR